MFHVYHDDLQKLQFFEQPIYIEYQVYVYIHIYLFRRMNGRISAGISTRPARKNIKYIFASNSGIWRDKPKYSIPKQLNLYIYIWTLLVCPFVSNKRQNGWTDWVQILFRISHDPREGLWMLSITKVVSRSFWFL